MLLIGGLKEKLLAAHRGGIKLVLIPEENTKDLADIPDNVKNAIEIVPVRWIDRAGAGAGAHAGVAAGRRSQIGAGRCRNAERCAGFGRGREALNARDTAFTAVLRDRC